MRFISNALKDTVNLARPIKRLGRPRSNQRHSIQVHCQRTLPQPG